MRLPGKLYVQNTLKQVFSLLTAPFFNFFTGLKGLGHHGVFSAKPLSVAGFNFP
jgi:hypothetical protein